MNDCKSLADALLAASSAASKTSGDKRLGIELSMIKQRLFRNETRFQWVERATMGADDLTKDKERGSRRTSQDTAARCATSDSCHLRDVRGKTANSCDTKNGDEQTPTTLKSISDFVLMRFWVREGAPCFTKHRHIFVIRRFASVVCVFGSALSRDL